VAGPPLQLAVPAVDALAPRCAGSALTAMTSGAAHAGVAGTGESRPSPDSDGRCASTPLKGPPDELKLRVPIGLTYEPPDRVVVFDPDQQVQHAVRCCSQRSTALVQLRRPCARFETRNCSFHAFCKPGRARGSWSGARCCSAMYSIPCTTHATQVPSPMVVTSTHRGRVRDGWTQGADQSRPSQLSTRLAGYGLSRPSSQTPSGPQATPAFRSFMPPLRMSSCLHTRYPVALVGFPRDAASLRR